MESLAKLMNEQKKFKPIKYLHTYSFSALLTESVALSEMRRNYINIAQEYEDF